MTTFPTEHQQALSAADRGQEKNEALRTGPQKGRVGRPKGNASKKACAAKKARPTLATGNGEAKPGASRDQPTPKWERLQQPDRATQKHIVPTPARQVRPVSIRQQTHSRPGTGIVLSLLLGNADWQADTVINHEGRNVWLKDAFTCQGKRIGVGACCLESTPCEWHEALGEIEQYGYPLISSKRCQ
jgi:hypothetical protein